MDRQERNAYYRDYMRLRRAAEKAGYDVTELSREQLFTLAEQGMIKPAARSAQKKTLMPAPIAAPLSVVTSPPAPVTYAPVKPTRPKPITSEASELQHALLWFIEEVKAEHALSEKEALQHIAEETQTTPAFWQAIMQGKNPGGRILQQIAPFISLYREQVKNAVPIPTYVPAPTAASMPIARNRWYTRLDQLDDFNRKRTI